MDIRDDDDYDIDFYTVGPVAPEHLEAPGAQPSPREQLEVCCLYALGYQTTNVYCCCSFWSVTCRACRIRRGLMVLRRGTTAHRTRLRGSPAKYRASSGGRRRSRTASRSSS